MLKIYTYAKCDTCRKATKFLKEAAIDFEEIPIREQPPTLAELGNALEGTGGNVRPLFNTSGVDYRSLAIGEKLPTMSSTEALELLAGNGNLVKRPFVIGVGAHARAGFQPGEWSEALGL